MTAIVDSYVQTLHGSATAAVRRSRTKPRAHQLLRVLADKKNILVTTHAFPDPDALASVYSLYTLLNAKLAGAKVVPSIKGPISGGLNTIFAQQMNLKLSAWNDDGLDSFDAIVLVDTQPPFENSPLPENLAPVAVIDHHRSVTGRRAKCAFSDIRSDVGATSSIIFSYFMELEVPISRDLGAFLLFAIESDLAGAASQPGELDNLALSSLTLIADPRKLYKMRYVDMPQSYYAAFANGLKNAVYYDDALISHLEDIDSLEKPAIIADFLLRFEPVQWSLVTAIAGQSLVMSLRTSSQKISAADMMRRLVRHLGQGGGHRTKAGGGIHLETGSAAEVQRLRTILRRRYLRSLGIKVSHAQKLVP